MTRPVHHYSVWFLSADGTFSETRHVSPKTLPAFRRNASLFFERRPDVCAFAVFVTWKKDERGILYATRAEILDNGLPAPKRFLQFLNGKLFDVNLGPSGFPLPRTAIAKAVLKHTARQRRRAKKTRPARIRTVVAMLDRISRRKPPERCNPDFALSMQFVISPGIQDECSPADAKQAVRRFQKCDWGEVDAKTSRKNVALTRAPKHEAMYGVYHSRSSGIEFWIVADPKANRALLLLPHEHR